METALLWYTTAASNDSRQILKLQKLETCIQMTWSIAIPFNIKREGSIS